MKATQALLIILLGSVYGAGNEKANLPIFFTKLALTKHEGTENLGSG